MNEESKRSPEGSDKAKPSLNMEELRELADLIDERGLTDFEFENEKIRVRMTKSSPVSEILHAQTSNQFVANTGALSGMAGDVNTPDVISEDPELHKILSPIVGTFFRAASPESDAFVKEGDIVNDESIVCIVEAMKLMNEVHAEISGKIIKIYVENGKPVEYGQPLFGVEQ